MSQTLTNLPTYVVQKDNKSQRRTLNKSDVVKLGTQYTILGDYDYGST